jgi:hypothetical protein
MRSLKHLPVMVVALVLFAFCGLANGQDPLFSYQRYLFGDPSTLSVWIMTFDSSSGYVYFNGVDTQGPSIPFTWNWGDGTSTTGWFPQGHTYEDNTRNYVLQVISHYGGDVNDTTETLVRFTSAEYQAEGLPEEVTVTIPSVMPSLTTRLYTPPGDLEAFDNSYFTTTPRSVLEDLLTVASAVQMDLTNEDVYLFEGGFRPVMLHAPGFGGAYSIWYTNPPAFGVGEAMIQGGIAYSGLLHELGHNYSLNSPASFYYGGRIDGNANAIFSETMAQIYQHATGYVIANSQYLYGIPDDLLYEIKSKVIATIKQARTNYEDYVIAGHPFYSWNDPVSPGDETLLTFGTLAYKFYEHAETSGWGYRAPLKRMMHLLQVFDADLMALYDQSNDTPEADSVRATLMTTAISYAFDTDLRTEFRDLNFPIKDSLYNALMAMAGDVNTVPVLRERINDTTVTDAQAGYQYDLAVSPTFTDPDGDPLSYSAASSNNAIAKVIVSGGSTIAVTPISNGEALITVTADDGLGGTEQTAFSVLIDADFGYGVTTVDTADLNHVRSADMDRDNYTDLIYCGSVDTGLFVAYGDSVDILSEPVKYADIAGAAIVVDYLDADTLLDIVAVDTNDVYVLINLGNRLFDVNSYPIGLMAGRSRWAPASNGIPSIDIGFLNDDIKKDIVFAPNNVWFGTGDGSFSGGTVLAEDVQSVTAADFNRDGRDDLLVLVLDSVKILTNAGSGTFSQTLSAYIGDLLLEVPPATASGDLDRNGYLDFALVVPLTGETDSSVLVVGLGDGTGGATLTQTRIAGLAYDIVATDSDRDGELDLVIGNGTYQRLEHYFGDGLGGFSEPVYIDMPADAEVITSLDLNRDGNPDFAAGGPGGDALSIAVDEQEGTTESLDELYVIGYDGVAVEVTDPLGFVVSENFQTVASSAYWRHDINNNDSLDDQLFDYNLMFGEYSIRLYPGPGVSQDVICCAGIGINGSRYCTFFDNYGFTPTPRTMNPGAVDTITFYYEVEATPSIFPDNGTPTGNEQPRFNWEGKVDELPPGWSYRFQLSPYYDFRTVRFDAGGLTAASYRPDDLLGIDSVYYWRFVTSDGITDTDTSRTFAAYIVQSCCVGMRGNIDGDSEELIDIGDLTALIRYLYIPPNPEPWCMLEANVDGDLENLVDIGDLTALISYLYIPPNPAPAECQ